MGFLQSDGFAVPVQLNANVLGNMLVLDETQLTQALKEEGLV